MMAENNANFGQSVTGVVIKDNKVLLARHTYGKGKGLLVYALIPRIGILLSKQNIFREI